MTKGMHDNELIKRALAEDRQAFAMLVERHYGFMFKVAWKWCGIRADAEDIAQDSAIKMASGLKSFRSESSFTTWLYRLVINTAKDYYRVKNRKSDHETALYDDVEFISPGETPEQTAEYKDVLRAINMLPEDIKEAVLLVCWHGLSHKEAAEALQCPEGTISWRISEARKKIAVFLSPVKEGQYHG